MKKFGLVFSLVVFCALLLQLRVASAYPTCNPSNPTDLPCEHWGVVMDTYMSNGIYGNPNIFFFYKSSTTTVTKDKSSGCNSGTGYYAINGCGFGDTSPNYDNDYWYWNGSSYSEGNPVGATRIGYASPFENFEWHGAGAPPYQLTVILNPQAGGTVTSDPSCLTCSNNTCTGSYTPGNVTLTATAADGWAFADWDDGTTEVTDNPLTINLTNNKTLYAEFFKTFRAAAGSYYASVGSTIDNGQCVNYVRYETGIPWADFNGDADATYQQAISAGYEVGATPRISSVIVFAAQGNMSVGHVGIVTSISGNSLTVRSQNFHNDEKVSDDVIPDITQYNVLGYIYYTP